MANVLWFSRHTMTDDQKAALGNNVTINQINKTIQHASEIQEEIEKADIVAIVAPIGLQAEFLRLAGDRPVITAVNDRVVVKDENGGEDKVEFRFVKWERLLSINVKKEDFNPVAKTDCECHCGDGNFAGCKDDCNGCTCNEGRC